MATPVRTGQGAQARLVERNPWCAIPLGVVRLVFWLLVSVVSVTVTIVVKILISATLLAVKIGLFVCRNLFRTFLS